MRGSRSLIAFGVAAALWVAVPGCSDEDASLSEVQGSGGAAGNAGATQDASAGGDSGAVTGGGAGSSAGGASGGPAGGAAGIAGSAGGPETGGSAPDADTGGAAGNGEGGSPPDSGIGGNSHNDAAPDSSPEAAPVVCATTAQCEAQWANEPCKANVVCEGASSTCKFSVLDKDEDGHPPVVCGGDDCDDSHSNSIPGGLEVCDDIDNDCNGSVDEGLDCGDPCPTGPVFVSCSADCGGPTAGCGESKCGVGAGWGPDIPGYPVVIRLPGDPGTDPECQWCPNGVTYALFVADWSPDTTVPQNMILRATVASPWKIMAYQSIKDNKYCTPAAFANECLTIPYPGTGLRVQFIFATLDPNAVARNARIELVPASEGCP